MSSQGYAGVSPASSTNFAGETPAYQTDGWHCRGYLPHCEAKNLQFITFRLFDSVPKEIIEEWKEELKHETDSIQTQKLLKYIDQYEDAGHGACFLKDERIAELVKDALLFLNRKRYRLLRWCIMPNHVHVLIEKNEDVSLSGILHSWRSYTSHKANEILRRTGDFWMKDYFDRFIRDENHLNSVINYIDNNPVKSGLVAFPEDWRWSSAYRHAGETPAYRIDSGVSPA